jgi:hypothetical protein
MPNRAGKIKATAPPAPVAPGAPPPEPATADTSLPDPTNYAKLTLAGLFAAAFGLAAVLNLPLLHLRSSPPMGRVQDSVMCPLLSRR